MKFLLNVLLIIVFTTLSSLAISGEWVRNLNFASGVVGVKAEGPDGFSGAAGRSYTSCINAEILPLHGKCAQLNISAGDTGFGVWGGIISFPQKAYRGETIWYLVHTYIPEDFDYHAYGAGSKLKFLRIHTADSAGKNTGYNDVLFDVLGNSNPLKYIYEGEQKWQNIGGINDFPVKNQWESYEFSVTLDTVPVASGGKALVRFWKNGVLIAEIKDRITLKTEDGYSDGAYLFTYWNGGAPKTQSMYVDEIIVTNKATNTDLDGNLYIGGLITPKRPKPPAPK